MANSLMDFGDITRTYIGLGNLEQEQRRNEIYEQNSQLEAGRLELARQNAKFQQFQDLVKLADDPRIRSNPEMSDPILVKAGEIAGIPQISAPGLAKARDQYRGLLTALSSGDQQKAHDALADLQIMLGPKDADQIVKSVGDNMKNSEYVANVESMRMLRGAQFEKLHNQASRVTVGLAPVTEASQTFATVLQGTDDPLFKQAMKQADRMKAAGKEISNDEIAVLASGNGKSPFNKDHALNRFLGAGMSNMAKGAGQRASQFIDMARDAQEALIRVDHGMELPDGVTRRDLTERVALGKELGQAYSVLATWGQSPFDKEALKQAKTAAEIVETKRKQLESLKTSTSDELLKLRQDALQFRMDEAGKKELYGKNVAAASNELLEVGGYTPTSKQLADVAKKYNVKPQDIEVNDPSKKGRLEVGIAKLGQEDYSRQFKVIENAQRTVDYINDLSDAISSKPDIVGKPAELKTAIAGAGQQLRAIFQMDPQAGQFLNTKPRDNAEALYEVLVYAQAKSMDPSGALDLKVIQHAREVLGDLNSFTTGPKQMLNKLETVKMGANRDIRRARQRIRGGVNAYLEDQPSGAPSKSVGEMSVQELMQTIIGGSE